MAVVIQKKISIATLKKFKTKKKVEKSEEKNPKLTTGQHGKNKSFEFLSFIKTEKNMCQVK